MNLTVVTNEDLPLDSYARLSRNPDGRVEKIELQHADNLATITRHGRQLGEMVSDNSFSAWKPNTKRPGWVKLLDRLEKGISGGVAIWHVDRLVRLPRDLETLLQLADERNFALLSSHGSRKLDDPDDRFILRIEVAHACRSSDDTSRRIKRQRAARREAGQLHLGGVRQFGWPGPDYLAEPGPDDRKPPASAVVVERERAAIRLAIKRALAGVTLSSIVEEWNAQELRTTLGNPWNLRTLAQMLTKPRNAGGIVHEGKVVGLAENSIVDRVTFDEFTAMMNSRKRGRPSGLGQHLGSGLLECGHCGRRLTGLTQKGKTYTTPEGEVQPARQYACGGTHGCQKVKILAEPVDRILKARAVRFLSDPAHAARISATISDANTRLDQITFELETKRGRLSLLAQRLGEGDMELDEYDAARKPLKAAIAKLEAEQAQLWAATPTGADELAAFTRDHVAVEWDNRDIPGRRELLKVALRGKRVVVHRPNADVPRGVFDKTRLEVLDIKV